MHADALMTGPLPEKPRTAQMKGAARHRPLLIQHQVWVGKIDPHERIIFFHHGAEQHRTLRPERKLESGEEPCPCMIEPLRAREDLVNVTVPIEDREGLPLLQHFRTAIRQ